MMDLRAMLAERHVSPAIIERIVRLNPNRQPGERLRGYRRASDERRELEMMGLVSRKKFVAAHGKEAWRAVPPVDKVRRGRRFYVTQEAMADKTWLHPGRFRLEIVSPKRAKFREVRIVDAKALETRWYLTEGDNPDYPVRLIVEEVHGAKRGYAYDVTCRENAEALVPVVRQRLIEEIERSSSALGRTRYSPVEPDAHA